MCRASSSEVFDSAMSFCVWAALLAPRDFMASSALDCEACSIFSKIASLASYSACFFLATSAMEDEREDCIEVEYFALISSCCVERATLISSSKAILSLSRVSECCSFNLITMDSTWLLSRLCAASIPFRNSCSWLFLSAMCANSFSASSSSCCFCMFLLVLSISA